MSLLYTMCTNYSRNEPHAWRARARVDKTTRNRRETLRLSIAQGSRRATPIAPRARPARTRGRRPVQAADDAYARCRIGTTPASCSPLW
eukprot:7090986-Prymnesium_polylepis.1